MEKIPKHAKKVFEGILFDVFHWEQKLFDQTTTTFEAVKRLPSAQLFVIKNDKIIINKEEQPLKGKYISMPGGIIDRGEEPIDGAKRELIEELGMKVNNEEDFIFYKKEDFASNKLLWETYYYIVKNPIVTTQPNYDSGEKITPFEVTFEEFYQYSQQTNFQNKNLSKYLKSLKEENKLDIFKNQLFN